MRNTGINWVLLSILLALTGNLSAQSFLTPLQSISGDAELVTADMQPIQGKVIAAMFGMKGLTNLTIKDEQGEKHKFKAEDVHSLRIKVDKLAKLEMIAEKTQNLEKLFNADFNEIVDREYVYYEQVQIPGKDKYVLSQLLNPGFNSKIKVFDKPGAKSGETSVNGIAVKGNNATAYYIEKDGIVSEISRSKYRKSQFRELFGDCSEMIDYYSKPEFEDFAEHVLFYELKCK